jgi:hypothetical protein
VAVSRRGSGASFPPQSHLANQHDFIALNFSPFTRDVSWGRADDFLPEQLYLTTNPLSLPLWTVGLSLCLFSASMKRFRPLGWMFVVTFILFLVNQGRGYYTGPAYVMLLAAGCVWFENWFGTMTQKKHQLGFGLLWTTQVIGSLIGSS